MTGTAEILIAGAGPTGLVLALWLSRMGVRVRIIDKADGPGTTSRAVAVQARTLEFYRQMQFADAVVAGGRQAEAVNLWVAGDHVAHAVFGAMGKGLSPFPYALIYPQDEHERLLIDRLAQSGVRVQRHTELLGLDDEDTHVVARIRTSSGQEEDASFAYVAGCDGAHSTVRDALSIAFAGGTYHHLFYVADVEAGGAALNGEVHVALDRSDFLAVFPLKGAGRARLVGTVSAADRDRGDTLGWNDISRQVIDWMRIDVRRVNWFSTYHVHHRVAGRFRRGRVFLLGDAAHIHSPVGGQGMNTGIGDAVNLGWKLAEVVHQRANATLLDTYEAERIGFARQLVDTTDRAFTAVTSSSVLARLIRLRIVPVLLPRLLRFAAVRRYMFRTVSQTSITYRDSPLSAGGANAISGGDRLPWVPPAAGEPDNHAPLDGRAWQVHVYGHLSGALKEACGTRSLALHVFGWRREMGDAGLERDAAYLIRPDGYVALADPLASAATLTNYLDSFGVVALRSIRPCTPSAAPQPDA